MPQSRSLHQTATQSNPLALIVTWGSGEETLDIQTIEAALAVLKPGTDVTIQTTEFRTEEAREVVYEPKLARVPDGFTLTYTDEGQWVDDIGELRSADGDLGTARYRKLNVAGKSKWVCQWVGENNPQMQIEIRCKLSDEVRDRKEVKALVRDARFRNLVLGDNPHCLVTGETDRRVLEAAHICAVKNEGNDGFENGIVLRADLHKLFDRHILTISNDGRFSMSPVLKSYNYLFDEDGKSWRRETLINHDELNRYVKNIDRRNAERVK